MKDDLKLLGEAINKWTLDALAKKEFHDFSKILMLGSFKTLSNSWSAPILNCQKIICPFADWGHFYLRP